MKMKLPKWVSVELLNQLIGEADDDSSRARYLNSIPRMTGYYFGYTDIADMLGLTEEEDDELIAKLNKIPEVVDKVNSIFLKNDPIVQRWPYRYEDADLVDDMDVQFADAWEGTRGQHVVRSMLNEAQLIGLSVGKVIWNPFNTEKHPEGEIMLTKLAPGSVRFDPEASNMHRARDCRYIIHTTRQFPSYVADRYKTEGKKAVGMLPSQNGSTKVGRMLNMGKDVLRKYVVGQGTGRSDEADGKIDVHEFWLFPNCMYRSELVSGEDLSMDKEYEYGLVVTMANDHIVRAIANPFVRKRRLLTEDENGFRVRRSVTLGHRRHPFTPLYWARTTDREGKGKYNIYDCRGMVENAISLVININNLRSNMAKNAQSVANPTIAVNEDSLTEGVQNMTWQPGQFIRIKQNYMPDQALTILKGGQMPPEVHQMVIEDVQSVERTMGLEPGVVGMFPSGTSHLPGISVGALQEAAFGPLWVYVAELSACLLDQSVLYDGLIQLKYKPGRYMMVSKQGEQRFVEWTNRHITAQFKRRIVGGSTTPIYDMDRETKVANVVAICNNAVVAQNPTIIQVAIEHIKALRWPWGDAFIQLLQTELQRLQQLQGLQALDSVAAMAQERGQLGQPAGLPPAQGQDNFEVFDQLAQESGRTPEQVLAMIES
jgi:hypothetical protein